jgi:hypothetical protein
VATVEPAAEGKQAAADFRIEGDILILKGERIKTNRGAAA